MTVRPPRLCKGPSSLLLLLLLGALPSCAPAAAQTDPPPRPPPREAPEAEGTLQVTGQAQIPVPADRVRISFAVETAAPSAAEATSLNAQTMESVVSALRSSDAPGMEIETYGYSLNPEYEARPEDPRARAIVGYRALNNIRVLLGDLEATGRILDRAVEAGANRIASLQFEASDTRDARLEALAQAVRNAREQAEAMAEAMGVRLGPALEVNGGASSPTPRPEGPMLMRAMAAETTTPVEAGSLTVSASVSITYRILERAP